jgi:hypothetical protein
VLAWACGVAVSDVQIDEGQTGTGATRLYSPLSKRERGIKKIRFSWSSWRLLVWDGFPPTTIIFDCAEMDRRGYVLCPGYVRRASHRKYCFAAGSDWIASLRSQ